jgi:hypothetical protein
VLRSLPLGLIGLVLLYWAAAYVVPRLFPVDATRCEVMIRQLHRLLAESAHGPSRPTQRCVFNPEMVVAVNVAADAAACRQAAPQQCATFTVGSHYYFDLELRGLTHGPVPVGPTARGGGSNPRPFAGSNAVRPAHGAGLRLPL